jgi:hypothetical protein
MRSAELDFGDRLMLVESRRLIENYGENALDRSALTTIAQMGPLVELGAGNGYNARLLQDLGADITATDISAPSTGGWFSVEGGSYDSVILDGRLPLLIWPFMNAPSEWLRSESAPEQLIVVNDVDPKHLGTRSGGSYHDVLFQGWKAISSFPVKSGWRVLRDWVHVWSR